MFADTRYELYRLAKDGSEKYNLIKDLKTSELLSNLKLLLEGHIKTVSPDGLGKTLSVEEELDQEYLERS